MLYCYIDTQLNNLWWSKLEVRSGWILVKKEKTRYCHQDMMTLEVFFLDQKENFWKVNLKSCILSILKCIKFIKNRVLNSMAHLSSYFFFCFRNLVRCARQPFWCLSRACTIRPPQHRSHDVCFVERIQKPDIEADGKVQRMFSDFNKDCSACLNIFFLQISFFFGQCSKNQSFKKGKTCAVTTVHGIVYTLFLLFWTIGSVFAPKFTPGF